MKKIIIASLFCCLICSSYAWGQEDSPDDSDADVPQSLFFSEETKPVPEDLSVGFHSITADELNAHLKFISSDLLEGRDPGTRGYDTAAEYAETVFFFSGVRPAGDQPSPQPDPETPSPAQEDKPGRSYMQQIEMKETVQIDGSAMVEFRKGELHKSAAFENNVDYQYNVDYPHIPVESEGITAPVVFVGYGISDKDLKFDEYRGVDTNGKIVMMLNGIPRKDDPDSKFAKKEIKDKYDPSPKERRSPLKQGKRDKIAQEHGAVAIIMIENSPETNGDVARKVLDSQRISDEKPIPPGKFRKLALTDTFDMLPFMPLPIIRVSRQMADKILKFAGEDVESLKGRIEDDLKPHSMELEGVSFTVENTLKTRLLRSANVLGYVEGSDPDLKDEVVVIGAHLDHLGKRGDYIFNGADDNGSGSVAVLELAQAFALNPIKPKRSLLFALWTAEEKGLLGSFHYTKNPVYPLEKTVANINIDMIGREWEDKGELKETSQKRGAKLSEEELEAIDVANFLMLPYKDTDDRIRRALLDSHQYLDLTVVLNKTKEDETGGGSDQLPFNANGIPWVFPFSAMHDDYHQPTDSVEKTSKELMEKTTRLVYLTAFSLANQ